MQRFTFLVILQDEFSASKIRIQKFRVDAYAADSERGAEIVRDRFNSTTVMNSIETKVLHLQEIANGLQKVKEEALLLWDKRQTIYEGPKLPAEELLKKLEDKIS